jgi:hypothetical protein
MTVLRASAWAWAGSSGLGARMPDLLRPYFGAERPPASAPPIDGVSLLRAVVSDSTFAARVAALQEA